MNSKKKLDLIAKLGIAAGLGLGAFGGVEVLKSHRDFKKLNPDEVAKIITGKKEASKSQIKALINTMDIKTPVHIARSVNDVKKKLMNAGGYSEEDADFMSTDPEIKDIFDNKTNAMYLLQNPDIKEMKAHILVVPEKASLPVIAHELGHAKDVEDAGGASKWQDKYSKKIHEHATGIFTRKPYTRTTRKREEAAWKAIPGDVDKAKAEKALLKTYDIGEMEMSGIKKLLLGTLLSGGGLYALKSKGWR